MDKINFKKYLGVLKKGIDKLSPPLYVGGLYITDTSITYLKVSGDKFDKVFLRFPSGVFEGGKIKDKNKLDDILKEFRKKILVNIKEKVFVVLSLQPGTVHIQTVPIPKVGISEKLESTLLNLRMVSPISINNAYIGWQPINLGKKNDLQENILGAFVLRNNVDELIEALNRVNISVTVIEFSSLSLTRAIDKKGILKDTDQYISVYIGVSGIEFSIVRDNLPLFHIFHSWPEIQNGKKTVLKDDFKSLLRDEIHRILNFYSSRWSDKPMEDIVVISDALFDEINSVAKEEFSNLKLQFHDTSVLNAVTGSAIRAEDLKNLNDGINLSNFSDSGALSREISINFVNIWRNFYVSVFGFLLIVFGIIDILLITTNGDLSFNREEVVTLSQNEILQFEQLSREANEFNLLVSKVGEILENRENISPLLTRLDELAGEDVSLTNIDFDSERLDQRIRGFSDNEDLFFSFKDRLDSNPSFSEVDYPNNFLRDVEKAPNGSLTFDLKFKVDGFDF